MKNRYTLLTASILCLGLSACGNSSLVAPENPLYNGFTFGSGHRTDSTTVTATSDGTTGERGGHGFGSGNRIEDPTVTSTTTGVERGGYTIGSGN